MAGGGVRDCRYGMNDCDRVTKSPDRGRRRPMPVDDGGEAAPIADGASATAGRLTWDCGDELLEKLAGAEREALREAISAVVPAALPYVSTTVDLDHVL